MYIYTDFCEQFSCEMCGSCCRNDWQVTVDEAAYRRNACLYASEGREAEFHKIFIPLQSKIPGEYASITKKTEGGCWFLDADNSCRLHRKAGHAHLDAVCRLFPRYPIETSRGLELTLSFCCPAVLRRAGERPVTIKRSDKPPLLFDETDFVAAVFPKQYADFNLLHYYFELEEYFIDVLQTRSRSLDQRIALIGQRLRELRQIKADETFGLNLSRFLRAGYENLAEEAALDNGDADYLLVNFFVNLVFKKTFYIYGFEKGFSLMQNMWQHLDALKQANASSERCRSEIMRLEFQYGHDRRSLGIL